MKLRPLPITGGLRNHHKAKNLPGICMPLARRTYVGGPNSTTINREGCDLHCFTFASDDLTQDPQLLTHLAYLIKFRSSPKTFGERNFIIQNVNSQACGKLKKLRHYVRAASCSNVE